MRLEVKNLNFSYGKQRIFNNFSFVLENTDTLGVEAPSGYGKSTLAKLLAGYLKAQSGEILIDNKKISNKGYNPIQLIYQHPEKAVNPYWKIKDVLEENSIDQSIIEGLKIQKHWFLRYTHELSGGELQRVCIARVFGDKTKFIIADETTAMLDAVSQADLWNFIQNECKKREIGLIIISHNPFLINKLCNKKINLSKL